MNAFLDRFSIDKFIAALASVAFVALVFVIIIFKPSIPDAAWAFIGILGTAFTTLIQFYWGSSSGSKSKDSALLPPSDQRGNP